MLARMARVLMPLPDHDFDPTETAVPWKTLTAAGHEVVFATESGATPACDPLLVTGVIFGQLGAKPAPKALYLEMARAPAFERPARLDAIDAREVDALVLPGGHAPRMKPYLESERLAAIVASAFRSDKPVAAICHGVLVAARARDPETGESVLRGRRTTCLPKYMERLAYYATAWKLGRYYRTYDAYVEDEVRAALESDAHFSRGPVTLFSHGTADDDRAAFVCEDGAYVSARWPGDAYLFARRLLARL